VSQETALWDEKTWIEPTLDGTGGGYGKFKGLSVREVAELFSQIAKDPSRRSFSGILRIAYEQLEGRSQLAVSVQASVVLGVVTLLIGLSIPFVIAKFPKGLPAILKAFGGSAALFAGFLIGALTTRRQARAAAAQERAIAELAATVLDRLSQHPEFRPLPLDSLQRQTLKKILKLSRSKPPALASLLELS
jgi:hypothetical protein